MSRLIFLVSALTAMGCGKVTSVREVEGPSQIYHVEAVIAEGESFEVSAVLDSPEVGEDSYWLDVRWSSPREIYCYYQPVGLDRKVLHPKQGRFREEFPVGKKHVIELRAIEASDRVLGVITVDLLTPRFQK